MFKDRTKSWGTGHAVMACKDIIKEPFLVINADDYYGKEAYVEAYKYLCEEHTYNETMMVGFILKNTLSDNGTVTRGICKEENGYLQSIEETYNIDHSYPNLESLASMNMWGFQPEFINKILVPGFDTYLCTITDPNAKGEYLLPTIIGGLLKDNVVSVKVLKSHDTWYGVTYKEDAPSVRKSIQALHDKGLYPEKL